MIKTFSIALSSSIVFLLCGRATAENVVCDGFNGVVTECDDNPCKCTLSDQFCSECHDNGCNECNDGYFKIDCDYPCTNCQEFFGDGCSFCQDFNGCGQCENNYERVKDLSCNLFYCVGSAEIVAFENGLNNMVSLYNLDDSYISDYLSYANEYDKLTEYTLDGSDNYVELKFRYEHYIDSDDYINNLNNQVASLIPEITNPDDLPSFDHSFVSDYDDAERAEILHDQDYEPSTRRRMMDRSLLSVEYITAPSFKSSDSSDYREYCQSTVTQRSCGSCWAFAATSQFECNYVINGGDNVKFSEQYALSCSNAGSCNGGWTHNVLTFYHEYGNCKQSDYGPYLAIDDTCNSNPNCIGKTIFPDGVRHITPRNDFNGAVNYISANKVAMIFHMKIVRSFYYISKASPYYWSCLLGEATIGYHAMTIVGHTTRYIDGVGDVNYLLIRNSWGHWWGDGGYFWMSEKTKTACNVYGYAWNYWNSNQPNPSPTEPPSMSTDCSRFGIIECDPLSDYNDNCKCEDNPYCRLCHPNGCDQCNDGYWQADYNVPCTKCQDSFGYGCEFCQDFNGCGQCKTGYTREKDEDCGVWYCKNT